MPQTLRPCTCSNTFLQVIFFIELFAHICWEYVPTQQFFHNFIFIELFAHSSHTPAALSYASFSPPFHKYIITKKEASLSKKEMQISLDVIEQTLLQPPYKTRLHSLQDRLLHHH